MAAELLEDSPAFHKSIQACADALQCYGIDLLAEFGRKDGWSTPALSMAGLCAVQVRLLLWPRALGMGLPLPGALDKPRKVALLRQCLLAACLRVEL